MLRRTMAPEGNPGKPLKAMRYRKSRRRNMTTLAAIFTVGAIALIFAQGGRERGDRKSSKSKPLEGSAKMLQSETPLASIHAHLCGFHFYSGDISRQVIAHHYCSHQGEEMMQCVIFDSDKKDAKLIGVEYIISARLFATLPEQEKKLWHSHVHEVKSGQLIAPHISERVETGLMEKLVTTYGKTWQTWQSDRGDELPLGIPQLMMGFTSEGQADPALVAARDRVYGISSEKRKQQRSDIPVPKIIQGADGWGNEGAIQLEIKAVGNGMVNPQPPPGNGGQ